MMLWRFCAIIALILGFSLPWSGAQAMWAQMSETALIESSDLIVVGRLVGTAKAPGTPETLVGIIDPETVLKGDTAIETIWLALPQPNAPVSSSDIAFRSGQEGLWFLRQVSAGGTAVYAADHPQRFVPIAEAGAAIEATRKALGQ